MNAGHGTRRPWSARLIHRSREHPSPMNRLPHTAGHVMPHVTAASAAMLSPPGRPPSAGNRPPPPRGHVSPHGGAASGGMPAAPGHPGFPKKVGQEPPRIPRDPIAVFAIANPRRLVADHPGTDQRMPAVEHR